MPRRLTLLLAATGLLAGACAPDVASFAPSVTRPEGARFLANAVDVRENAGVGLAVAVDRGGLPSISYLRLDEAERIPQAPIPADPQYLPAVMVATLGPDGIWSRLIVAQESARGAYDAARAAANEAGVEPPERPDFTADDVAARFENLGPDDSTDVAVDGDGNRHVTWTNGNAAVQYANESGGFASGPNDPIETVAEGTVSGVSIAAGSDGAPWIAFYDGGDVRVATPADGGWSVETVLASRAGAREGSQTDIAVGDGGPVVAFGEGDTTVVAVRAEGGWESSPVPGDGGYGVSLYQDGQASHLAYYSRDGEVFHAEGALGDYHAESVADATGDVSARSSTGIGVVDGEHVLVWHEADGSRVMYRLGEEEPREMPASLSGADPHLAAGAQGPVAAWYQTDTTSLASGIFTDEDAELAIPSPDAGIGGGGGGSADCTPDGTDLAIAALAGAAVNGFDTDCLAVAAGEVFTIDFDNQDTGALHNVAIYTEQGGGELFVGEILTGPDQVTYEPDPLDAGELFFQCDIHPTTMVGTFVVTGEGGSGGEPTPTSTASATPAGGISPGGGDPTPTPSA